MAKAQATEPIEYETEDGAVISQDDLDAHIKARVDEVLKKSIKRPDLRVGDPVIESDEKAGFKTFNEFLYHCIQSECNGIQDKRMTHLKDWSDRIRGKAVGSDEYRAISNPDGGFLIPPGYSRMLLSTPNESDPIRSRAQMIRIEGTDNVTIPRRVDKDHTTQIGGGVTAYWTEETAAITSSKASYNQVKFQVHTLAALAYASERLLRYSAISQADIMARNFQDAINDKLFDAWLNGTGAGQPVGINNCDALVTVSAEASQAATTIVAENVLKMAARCYGYNNAFWLANHDTYVQLRTMAIATGTGGQLVWGDNLVEDKPPTLLGRPVYFSEYPATLGTVGDLLLVNPKEYGIGIASVNQAESIHVRFINDERAFRVTMDVDGQPLWEAAMTPKRGADTLSPFVNMATRS